MSRRRIITRKRLIRLGSSLILGAVTSIVIAWSCTLWSPTETRYHGPIVLDQDVRWWQDHIDDPFPLKPSGCAQTAGFGKESVLLYHMVYAPPNLSVPHSGSICYAGWPWYCLRGGMLIDRTRRQVSKHHIVYGVGWIPWRQQVWLPIEILWPGLISNAAIYGAAIFLLWSGIGLTRRRIRLKRGKCPQCAYVLSSGSPRCPECGWHRPQQLPQ